MRQFPYRLLAALTITLTLGGCVTYPAAPPVIGGGTYVRKATPVYSYTVITDPGYRYYDDTLGVYVFYDRSDVFFRQGHYYRWHQDHWISANHWRGPWYPAPNFYVSANFNDRWHTRLRRHGHHYAGGRDYRPPRRHDHDDGYNRRDRHEGNGQRPDRRNGRGNPTRNSSQNPGRDVRPVKVVGKPIGIRDPRVVPASEHPATDRRAVRDKPKPQNLRGQPQPQPQPQPQRNVPNDRRDAAAKPAPRQEREQPENEQPKEKEKKKQPRKRTDERDQVRPVREPLSRRSNEARRRID